MALLQSLAQWNAYCHMRYYIVSLNIRLYFGHWWLDLWTVVQLRAFGAIVKNWNPGLTTRSFKTRSFHWAKPYRWPYMVTGPNSTGKTRCLFIQYLPCSHRLGWYKTFSSTNSRSWSYPRGSWGVRKFPNGKVQTFWNVSFFVLNQFHWGCSLHTLSSSHAQVSKGVNKVAAELASWSIKCGMAGVGPDRGFRGEELSGHRAELIGKNLANGWRCFGLTQKHCEWCHSIFANSCFGMVVISIRIYPPKLKGSYNSYINRWVITHTHTHIYIYT